MNRITLFLSLSILLIGCSKFKTIDPMLNLTSGSIERFENFPSKFIKPRNIDVWLPSDYSTERSYAVIYMHDGQMLFDASTTWNNQEWGVDETISELMSNGSVKKCIIVGIWNSGESRHSDYFPQKPFESLDSVFQDSLLRNAKRYNTSTLFADSLQADNYLRFIVDELKPIIDYKYSTLIDRENTIIVGSSMGGLISMYAICEYPNVFGGTACLSTHWPGTFSVEDNPIPVAFANYLITNIPNPQSHKFYFDYGTETLDSLYEPFQANIDSIMEVSGYNNNNWITHKFVGHDHSEKSWAKRLHVPFTFLLKP